MFNRLKNISRLSDAGSKMTPLCNSNYSKVKESHQIKKPGPGWSPQKCNNNLFWGINLWSRLATLGLTVTSVNRQLGC